MHGRSSDTTVPNCSWTASLPGSRCTSLCEKFVKKIEDPVAINPGARAGNVTSPMRGRAELLSRQLCFGALRRHAARAAHGGAGLPRHGRVVGASPLRSCHSSDERRACALAAMLHHVCKFLLGTALLLLISVTYSAPMCAHGPYWKDSSASAP